MTLMKKCLNCGFVFRHGKQVRADWIVREVCPKCGSDAVEILEVEHEKED